MQRRPISVASHLRSSFLPLQLGAERSRWQIQRTDKQTDSCSGLFSMVAGSHSSLSSRSLRLLVSDFTSSGQRVKLAALVRVPSVPFVVALHLLDRFNHPHRLIRVISTTCRVVGWCFWRGAWSRQGAHFDVMCVSKGNVMRKLCYWGIYGGWILPTAFLVLLKISLYLCFWQDDRAVNSNADPLTRAGLGSGVLLKEISACGRGETVVGHLRACRE